MNTLTLRACAKINWCLDITGTRADGYHLMDMLMQPISLSDTIALREAEDLSLTVSGTPLIPPDEHHLALRAARALNAALGGGHGAAIHVHKRIPAGAGLGGGSADAAGVLAGLNRLWAAELSPERLRAIGLTLGADVPFCLHGGLCRVQGIGEALTPLPVAPRWPLVLIQPCAGLSTGAVFQRWQAECAVHPPVSALADKLVRGEQLPRRTGNSLTAVSETLRPEIGEAVEALLSLNALCAEMSGSGSAVFGVFQTMREAAIAAERLRASYATVCLCETCERGVIFTGEEA